MTGRYTDGQPVTVIDADGEPHHAVARSDVEGTHRDGRKIHSFPVVWVEIPGSDGDQRCVPWPAESVHAR